MRVTVVVFDGEQYHGGWPPSNAIGFLAWLAEKIDSIPAEHRESALIEINSYIEYYSSQATIKITYSRPITSAEIDAENKKAETVKRNREQEERQQLARLQAKYGNVP
jgi:hypothetical protein